MRERDAFKSTLTVSIASLTFTGWSDASPEVPLGVEWEEDGTGWGVPRPGIRGGILPGTPGPGSGMGGLAYGDGRALAPGTPAGSAPPRGRIMEENNSWGSFPLKNNKVSAGNEYIS